MIAVLDYGIGNVRSVLNAFKNIGENAQLTRDATEVSRAVALVLPGVGSFGEGMRRIDEYRLRPMLADALRSRKPVLGICLGFELMMKGSDEMGSHEGLGYFPLDVRRLSAKARLPHVGWSSVRTHSQSHGPSRLLSGIEGEQFYFVHSYGVESISPAYTTATATYGNAELVAVIEHDHLFGAQFHPEKSGESGLQLLKNFSALART